MIKNIPFLSFLKIHQDVKTEIFKAFLDVYESNSFILGDNVKLFEDSYAKFNDTRFCIGVGNGLDALTISLRALEISFGIKTRPISNNKSDNFGNYKCDKYQIINKLNT